MSTHKHIELLAPEIQHILSNPPRGLSRSGSSCILILLILLLFVSYWIQYPDIVPAEVDVTTSTPPIWIQAKVAAPIACIYVQPGDTVQKGTPLALLDQSANPDDVLYLKQALESCYVQRDLLQLEALIASDAHRTLGMLQSNWQLVCSKHVELYSASYLNSYELEQLNIQQKRLFLQQKLKGLEQELTYEKQRYQLAHVNIQREKQLLDKGIVSRSQYESVLQEWTHVQQSVEQAQRSIASLEMDILDVETRRTSLQEIKRKQQFELSESMWLTIKTFVAAIVLWEQNYLISSPEDGVLIQTYPINEWHNLNVGDRLFALLPKQSGSYVAHLTFDQSSKQHVLLKDRVFIQLDGYPAMEYGRLECSIDAISNLPDPMGALHASCILPDTLQTEYGKRIRFDGRLTGNARIVTENKRLLHRLIYPIRHIHAIVHSEEDNTRIVSKPR